MSSTLAPPLRLPGRGLCGIRSLTLLLLVLLPGSSLAARSRQGFEEVEVAVQENALLTPDLPIAPQTNPIVFVPGITSSVLEARRKPGTELGDPSCEPHIPKDGWYPLYLSAARATHPGCLLWQLQLQSPQVSTPTEGAEGPESLGCVKDAEGIEVREVGFGGTEGSARLNPGDPIHFPLFEEMIKMFESLGLQRDETIRFATYDWRKYGDPCWEQRWFPKFKALVEETVDANGTITLACHSMGCPLVHLFLSTVTAEWKHAHIREFVATAPAFAGAPALLQNFIQGPTYAFLPMLFSTIGRATMNSMPGGYTLLPNRLGGAWSEDLALISTPWRNFTLASVFDGSIFNEVEAQEEQNEREVEVRDAGGSSTVQWQSVRAGLDQQITTEGCVCSSACTSSLGGPNPGVLDTGNPTHDWSGLARPWCYTYGSCGSRTVRLRPTLNIFKVLQLPYWDFCGQDSKAIDAGRGFEFFPGVTTEAPGLFQRWFGEASSYDRDTDLQIEEHKARCLESAECVGFDTDGYLKRGDRLEPATDWRGIKKVRDGVLQGLYMKKPEVQQCQVPCKDTSSLLPWRAVDTTVCGSDGKTYASECLLNNAACWQTSLKVASQGPCEQTYRTPQGCTCSTSCNPAAKGKKSWCYVEDGCGFYSMVRLDYWDFCTNYPSIDTGAGFEYFPGTALPEKLFVLKEKGWFETYYMDRLQDECGRDPACGGFSTDGTLFTKDFVGSAETWIAASSPRSGLYSKKKSLLACQRPCTDDEATLPVCYQEEHETFLSSCAAENYRCVQGLSKDEFRTTDGPCQRYGDTGLHRFGVYWANRVSKLGPPGVPTTCMYITDVETDLAWTFKNFLSKGTVVQTSPGDGSVNAASAEAPCKSWMTTQNESVKLMPLKMGGASHVTMLWNAGFLDAFKHVLLKDDFNCQRVDGARVRDSEGVPDCKCANEGSVFCGSEEVAKRKFDLKAVLAECESPFCASCDDVDGATTRNSEELPHCKCSEHEARVYCGTKLIDERKFLLGAVLGNCPAPYCAVSARVANQTSHDHV